MSKLNFVIAYVEDAPKAAELYSNLLGATPVESSPNWALFALSSGLTLGLWARNEVQPRPDGAGGGELCVEVETDDQVATTFDAWQKLGVEIIQQPTRMDFGLTFTAADPDRNRLRVFSPSQR
ncbi:MAG: drug:proton antiporter [Devosia sp.]|uniref:VOC family protein n=1 Tax=Devosia sp. TaxID=1871048 RepID=UPI00261A06C1|nr:VOC family protein [Devosia sp.]MDB5541351.1 drug:proton antiporter [Devosia sp.]